MFLDYVTDDKMKTFFLPKMLQIVITYDTSNFNDLQLFLAILLNFEYEYGEKWIYNEDVTIFWISVI